MKKSVVTSNPKRVVFVASVIAALLLIIGIRHVPVWQKVSHTVSIMYTYQYEDEQGKLLTDTVIIGGKDAKYIAALISRMPLRYNFIDEMNGVTDKRKLVFVKDNNTSSTLYLQYANSEGVLYFGINSRWHVMLGERTYAERLYPILKNHHRHENVLIGG